MHISLLKPGSGIRLWMLASCVLFFIAIFALSGESFQHFLSYQSQQEKLLDLQKRSATKQASKPTKFQLDNQKHWERLVADVSYPWNQVFRSIERASDSEIELLVFEPDKRNRHIILSGEAKNQKALEQFLRKLEGDTNFFNVHLTHQEKVKHERLETLSFEIKTIIR